MFTLIKAKKKKKKNMGHMCAKYLLCIINRCEENGNLKHRLSLYFCLDSNTSFLVPLIVL